MALILQEPNYIMQEKANSCWFACLKMLMEWHTGSRSVGDERVSALASWTTPRHYDEIPDDYLLARNVAFTRGMFASSAEIEAELRARGPFVGGGAVGKFFGKRMFGHAILIYGVTSDDDILHHDPMSGRASKIKWTSYLGKQDGERLRMRPGSARVVVAGQGV